MKYEATQVTYNNANAILIIKYYKLLTYILYKNIVLSIS